MPIGQNDERRKPALANESVAREALWSIFLLSMTAEQREEVESLSSEEKSGALHRWVLSTTGSSACAPGSLEEWLNSLYRNSP